MTSGKMKYLSHKTMALPDTIKPLKLAMICPGCSSEIAVNEMFERKGSVGCINCLK